jgi:aminobenzoyl-glutamate transport protein
MKVSSTIDGTDAQRPRQRGFLGLVERAGNLLPEPAMIFVWLIGILMVLSAIASWAGLVGLAELYGREAPQWGELENGVLTYRASSLFNEENVARLLTEMPRR